MSVFPRSDVRFDRYIGKCPACSRIRLELYIDGEETPPRCVGVRCEKCHAQWLFNPKTAEHWNDGNDQNPLVATRDENHPFTNLL